MTTSTATTGRQLDGVAPVIYRQKPLGDRLLLWLQAMALSGYVAAIKNFKPIKDCLWPPAIRPSLTKRYSVRPTLPIRVFFPENYDPSKPAASLPCLFTVHGGGFVVGIPDVNDDWNHQFSNTHGALVIAINYRKAPGYPYPTPVHDVASLITAVLDDAADLARHIDTTRVAIAGFSAGANLGLAVTQMPELRARVQALVPLYPACDFSTPPEIKFHLRRFKPELGGYRGRDSDYLLALCPVFDWSYVPAGQDMTEPQLSPLFAPVASLPRRIFLIACEMDILAHEAWQLACKLAGKRVPGLDEQVGRPEVGEPHKLELNDERFHWQVKTDDGREVRWMLVPDALHAFDQELRDMQPDDKVMQADSAAKTTEEIKLIGKWLWG